jgi:hypothetical protein
MNKKNSPKPYSISFEHRPDYLYAYVAGDADSYEISKAYWLEVAQECQRHDTQKLLVDEDITEQISAVSEVFHGASERPHMGLSGVKIAFVDRHVEQHEQNLFGELVATNRGLLCKVFKNFAEGEEWLLKD